MKIKSNVLLKFFVLLSVVFTIFGTVCYGLEIDPNVEQVETVDNTAVKTAGQVKDAKEGIFDIVTTADVYKESTKDTKLPFVRYVADRILVDKDVNNMGMMISGKSIEITNNITAPQLIISGDSVHVKGNIADSLIFSNGNVTIDGKVDGELVIFSSSTVIITENAEINGDVIVYTPKLILDGKVNGSVLGTANKVQGKGKITKDLRLVTNEFADDVIEVSGNAYFNTFNYNENMLAKYPNATINKVEVEKTKGISMPTILDGIILCIIFSIMYGIFSKFKNHDVIQEMLEKASKRPMFVVMSGALILMVIPLVILLVITLLMFRLWIIAVPILLIYFSFVVIVAMFSTFVVGSLIIKYMEGKYKEKIGNSSKYIFAFVVFLVLHIFARIPVIGSYVTMLLVMLAMGISFTSITKRKIKE